MKIPEFLYGPYREVKKKSNKILRELTKGAIWEEKVEAFPMLDTNDMEGNLIMDGPYSGEKDEEHFQMYAFLSLLDENESLENRQEEIFYKHLETPWGTFSLMAVGDGIVQSFLIPPKRHIPFLKSVSKFWEMFLPEEKNFTRNGDTSIWSYTSTLKFVLARRGVPNEILRGPLPKNDLEAFLKKYNFPNMPLLKKYQTS
ncbi:MAG: hypothetical protein GY757_10815 [bacterium]|nr:hypothetical protein [bacterium]